MQALNCLQGKRGCSDSADHMPCCAVHSNIYCFPSYCLLTPLMSPKDKKWKEKKNTHVMLCCALQSHVMLCCALYSPAPCQCMYKNTDAAEYAQEVLLLHMPQHTHTHTHTAECAGQALLLHTPHCIRCRVCRGDMAATHTRLHMLLTVQGRYWQLGKGGSSAGDAAVPCAAVHSGPRACQGGA